MWQGYSTLQAAPQQPTHGGRSSSWPASISMRPRGTTPCCAMLSAGSQVHLTLTLLWNRCTAIFVTFAAAPEMLHSWVAWMMTNYQGFWMRALAFACFSSLLSVEPHSCSFLPASCPCRDSLTVSLGNFHSLPQTELLLCIKCQQCTFFHTISRPVRDQILSAPNHTSRCHQSRQSSAV